MRNLSSRKHFRMSQDFQAKIELPPIPLLNKYKKSEWVTDYVKAKTQRKPGSTTSDTYRFKIQMYKTDPSEEFLLLLRTLVSNSNKTGTTSPYGQINYLLILLH